MTEEAFVAWYLANVKSAGSKKRSGGGAVAAEPAAKKQATLPGASAPGATLSKAKKAALLKAVTTSLKASIKGKKGAKWHAGDVETLAGTAVMDKDEFAQLFPGAFLRVSFLYTTKPSLEPPLLGVEMTKKGVTTSFSLGGEQLGAAFGGFKASVACWSRTRPGSFQKSYKTGSEDVTLSSAEGKFSTGTSTLTLKFKVVVGGDCEYGGTGGRGFGGRSYGGMFFF